MQITVPNQLLAQVVNISSRVIKSSINIPILRNVLIDFGKKQTNIITTDLETQFKATLNIGITNPAKITVHSSTFAQYLNSLDKDESITLELEKNRLIVKDKNSSASFTIKEADEYPTLSATRKEKIVVFTKEELINSLERTLFAASKDDIRPILTGIHFSFNKDHVDIVALDTFRMSYVKIAKKPEKETSLTIPSSGMQHLLRILRDGFLDTYIGEDEVEVYLGSGKNQEESLIIFKYGIIELTVRLLEGEYPNYKDIIPTDNKYQYEIDQTLFTKALKRVGIFAQNSITQRLVLEFSKDKLTLSAEAQEMGDIKEVVPIKAVSKETKLTVGFQYRFLLEIVQNINSDSFYFKSNGETAPALFVPTDDENFIHIVMPLKL